MAGRKDGRRNTRVVVRVKNKGESMEHHKRIKSE